MLENEKNNETNENVELKEIEVRRNKLNEMISIGDIPYKSKFDRTHTLKEARTLPMGTEVALCGRLVSKRIMGKLLFAHVYDVDAQIQLSISKGDYPEAFAEFKNFADNGDFVGFSGELYTTGTGEITVRAKEFVILSKSLRSLPEKFHGFNDMDAKYRQRYLDIIANEESRNTFKIRLKTIANIRKYLNENGFIEVETPILQNVASGANARPFITKHNALNKDYFLRIAPELYLKQIIACGFDRVYEIGKCFRNEGMDASHLQEFTMLEWYCAYWDYEKNIEFVTGLLQNIIKDIKGEMKLEYQGETFDFSSFARINYIDEINKVLETNVLDIQTVDEIKDILSQKKMFSKDELDKLNSITGVVDYIFKKKIRPGLKQPTITYNYPAFMIPLARRNDKDNRIIDMFQILVNGWEICKAYSELVNPITQRQAFVDQLKDKMAGDEEAMDIDENFVLAMEHGMPPISGLGLGIDRLITLLADQPTLRDVIFFPIMK